MIDYILDQTQRLVKSSVRETDTSYMHFVKLWEQTAVDPNSDSTFNRLIVIHEIPDDPLVGEIPQMRTILETMGKVRLQQKRRL